MNSAVEEFNKKDFFHSRSKNKKYDETNSEICKVCKKCYKNFKSLCNHLCRPFSCLLCKMQFENDSELKIHSLNCETISLKGKIECKGERRKCDRCGKILHPACKRLHCKKCLTLEKCIRLSNSNLFVKDANQKVSERKKSFKSVVAKSNDVSNTKVFSVENSSLNYEKMQKTNLKELKRSKCKMPKLKMLDRRKISSKPPYLITKSLEALNEFKENPASKESFTETLPYENLSAQSNDVSFNNIIQEVKNSNLSDVKEQKACKDLGKVHKSTKSKVFESKQNSNFNIKVNQIRKKKALLNSSDCHMKNVRQKVVVTRKDSNKNDTKINCINENSVERNNSFGSKVKVIESKDGSKNLIKTQRVINSLPDSDCGILLRAPCKNGENFKCVKCMKLFKLSKHCSSHYSSCKGVKHKTMLISFDDVMWTCTLCNKTFDNISELASHKKSCLFLPVKSSNTSQCASAKDSIVFMHKCKTCFFQCCSSYMFENHNCQKRLKDLNSCIVSVEKLKLDIVCIRSIQLVSCSVCKAMFFENHALKQHISKIHGISSPEQNQLQSSLPTTVQNSPLSYTVQHSPLPSTIQNSPSSQATASNDVEIKMEVLSDSEENICCDSIPLENISETYVCDFPNTYVSQCISRHEQLSAPEIRPQVLSPIEHCEVNQNYDAFNSILSNSESNVSDQDDDETENKFPLNVNTSPIEAILDMFSAEAAAPFDCKHKRSGNVDEMKPCIICLKQIQKAKSVLRGIAKRPMSIINFPTCHSDDSEDGSDSLKNESVSQNKDPTKIENATEKKKKETSDIGALNIRSSLNDNICSSKEENRQFTVLQTNSLTPPSTPSPKVVDVPSSSTGVNIHAKLSPQVSIIHTQLNIIDEVNDNVTVDIFGIMKSDAVTEVNKYICAKCIDFSTSDYEVLICHFRNQHSSIEVLNMMLLPPSTDDSPSNCVDLFSEL